MLGSIADADAVVRRLGVQRVIIAFTVNDHEEMLRLVRRLTALDVQIELIPRYFEVVVTPRTSTSSRAAAPTARGATDLPHDPGPEARHRRDRRDRRTRPRRPADPGDRTRHQVRLARAGPLQAGPAGRVDARVHQPEVPHDGGQRLGRGAPRLHQRDHELGRAREQWSLQARSRLRDDAGRSLAPPYQPRRAPPTVQRPTRGHLSCRSPALHPLRGGALPDASPRSLPRPRRHHRVVASDRAGTIHIRRGARPRRRLRPQLLHLA